MSWQWPLRPVPVVLRGFSAPPEPWLPGHRGVDLAARPGQPVHAAGPGLVSYAARLAGQGVVAITHGELRTTYLPVDASVRAGQRVAPGQPLGRVAEPDRPGGPGGFGAPGRHCPVPCLHWGLLRGRSYLDPLSLVHGRVRLLPRWPPHQPPGRPAPAARPAAGTSPAGGYTTVAAGGGMVAGLLVGLGLAFTRRRTPGRRRLPPDVIDLRRERVRRRPPA
ncbi:M23 family peptidase [Actinomadura craniellae]|uniref:M23 family peptidase n=1 Tax=Actinomadura craniellae TaxID=2231787 RepID=A0A365H0L7_9ACTN|nr:M23 family peptidase [Actinomadura craniellae]